MDDILRQVVPADLVEEARGKIQIPAELLAVPQMGSPPHQAVYGFRLRKERLPLLIGGGPEHRAEQASEKVQLRPVPEIQRQGSQIVFILLADRGILLLDQAADEKLCRGIRLDKGLSRLGSRPCSVDQAEGKVFVHQKRRKLQRRRPGRHVLFEQLQADLLAVRLPPCIHIAHREPAIASRPSRHLFDGLRVQPDLPAVDELCHIAEDDPLDIVVLADRDRIRRDEAVGPTVLKFARLLHLDLIGKLPVDDRGGHPVLLEPLRHLMGAKPGKDDIGVIFPRSLEGRFLEFQLTGPVMLDDLPGIPAQLDQLPGDLQAAPRAADTDRLRIDPEDRVRIERAVLPRDQLAFVDDRAVIRTVIVEHPDRLRDMLCPLLKLLLLSCREGTGNAVAADHLPPFISQHAKRAQIDAGRRVRHHRHRIIRLPGIGSAYMDDEMPPDAARSGEQIRDVRRSREADGIKQLQHLHGREQLESGGAGPEELRVLSDLRRDVPKDHRPPQVLAGRHHPGNEKLLRPVEAGVGRISPPAAAPVLPEASPVTV